jgi:putative ABC transport system permease protein
VATLEPSGSGLDAAVFVPLDTVYAVARESRARAERPLDAAPGRVSAVLVRLKPAGEGGVGPLRAAVEIERALPEATAILPDDLLQRTRATLAAAQGAIVPATRAIWPAAVLLAGLAFAAGARERRAEIGLLRVMGATRGFVFALIVLEACAAGLAGAVLGIGTAIALFAALLERLGRALATPLAWPAGAEVAGLALVAGALAIASAAAAACIPAIRASLVTPCEAVRGSVS